MDNEQITPEEQSIIDAERLLAERDAKLAQEANAYYTSLMQQFSQRYPQFEIVPVLNMRKKNG